jgi:CheY-like chemotaxis protein
MAAILVIDDDEQTAALLRQMLERAGYEVLSANNGAEAVKLLERHDVKVIVTDILMPGMDGMELILKLKFEKKAPIIVAVSGGGKYYGAGECLTWARNLGIQHTFAKPIPRTAFLNKIRELMTDRSA